MRLDRSLLQPLEKNHFSDPPPKMAFVVGPRQVGKTTLARQLLERRGSTDLYRNWDDLEWRRELSRSPYGFLDAFRPQAGRRPLAVLDEIHRFPRWKRYVKGLWDTRGQWVDVLVTGSGRLDVYRRGGDSLLGRYHQYRLHPLSISEVIGKKFDPESDSPAAVLQRLLGAAGRTSRREREAFEVLLRFGGFPEPYLRARPRQHRLWLRERRERLIREDLRDLSGIQMLASVEQMAELLTLRVGSLLSLNNLRGDLGVSLESVRLWMDSLERLYFCFRIRPFAGKLSRTLSREPKPYLFDWSELPEPGPRLENMIASALLRWTHFTQDWGQDPLTLHFIRDKEKREVDFLLIKNKKPFLLIEVKLSDPRPGPALEYFSERLGGVPKLVVVGKLDTPGTASNTPILPAPTFLSHLP